MNIIDYLRVNEKSIAKKHGYKIDFDYVDKCHRDYLDQINPIAIKPLPDEKYNYESFVKYCCLSFFTNYRFVPSDLAGLPDLQLSSPWLEIKQVRISKLNRIQFCKLSNDLLVEHIHMAMLSERSIMDRLIIDQLRMERKCQYSNSLLSWQMEKTGT